MKKENQPLSFASIALALANDYSRLFVIDSDDDSYIEYTTNGAEKELVQVAAEENFFQAVPRDAREQVWPEDQEYFLNAFQKDTMMTALENGRSFSLTYRLNLEGNPHYFSLKAIRASDHNIIIGVQDVDARKRKELESEDANRTYTEIVKSLASQYVAIYHVDLTTGHYMEYSSNDRYAKLGFFRPGEGGVLPGVGAADHAVDHSLEDCGAGGHGTGDKDDQEQHGPGGNEGMAVGGEHPDDLLRDVHGPAEDC